MLFYVNDINSYVCEYWYKFYHIYHIKKIKTPAAQMNAFAFLQQKGLKHKYNDLLLMTSKSKKCRI